MINKINREKHSFDAAGEIAGRLASKIAYLLMGKNVVGYRPNIDAGAEVEVSNINKLKFSGKKLLTEVKYHHSQHPGGLKSAPLAKLFKENPGLVFKKIVYNMLPKNKLRPEMIKRLNIK